MDPGLALSLTSLAHGRLFNIYKPFFTHGQMKVIMVPARQVIMVPPCWED